MTATDPPAAHAQVPPGLRASVERHQANLARLVSSLRQAGMDEPTIEASVSGIVESYRIELVGVMKALAAGRAPDDDRRKER